MLLLPRDECGLQVELEVDEIMEKFDDGGGTIDFDEFTMMVEEMEAFKKSGHCFSHVCP